jgi:hypothetical protein
LELGLADLLWGSDFASVSHSVGGILCIYFLF